MEAYSDWFPREVKPVHIGVYEVRVKANGKIVRWFSYWNGLYWCLSASTPESASKFTMTHSDAAEHAGGFEWRGLVKG
jgi:hypothetical protein